jgi:hypothetical protein
MPKVPFGSMTCPHCQKDAPTIVRGVRAYCTACGAPRSLINAPEAVNVAGQPARIGGTVFQALGAAALGLGLVVALLIAGIAGAFLGGAAALWVGVPIALIALVIALPIMGGGRRLQRAGEARSRAAQETAIFALAAQRRGVLTLRDVARALSIREDEADALLTALAKRPDGAVVLDVDDNGALSYRFPDLVASYAPGPAGARVRVPDQPWRVPEPAAPPVRVASPQVIDAELIEEQDEGHAGPMVRRASR